jgi:predicted nucleic acid-binding protein
LIVVDTNILAYRFISGRRSEEADRLAEMDPAWAAPVLWRSELRNVLSGYIRRGDLNRALAQQAMQKAASALTAGEHPVNDAAVFELMQGSRSTSYDCEFVALALELDALLVTEDSELLRVFPAHCRSLAQALAK